jgi:hypothetical protein
MGRKNLARRKLCGKWEKQENFDIEYVEVG